MSTSTPTLPKTPPAGFAEVASEVEGIRVFAPEAEKEAQDDARAFQCPACGAQAEFEVGAGTLTCPYCDHVQETEQQTLGKEAEGTEFTLEALQRAEHGWGVERKELQCDGCAAELTLDAGELTTSCPFCGSSACRIREEESKGLKPRFLIPFSVQRDEVVEKVRGWLSSGWMHPKELSKMASLDRFKGVYVPYWTFSAGVASDWRAQVGHTQTYYVNGKRRTRTVWRWESGHARIRVEDLLVAGTTRLEDKLLERVADFQVDGFVPYGPEYLAGFQAQTYDVGLLDAWDQGRAEIRQRARSACIRQCSTSRVRNLSLTADLDDEMWRYVLMPVWLGTFEFNGRAWQVMVNGQTGTVVGHRPVTWWKIWAAMALIVSPTILVAVAGLMGMAVAPLVGVEPGVPCCMLVASLVIGVVSCAMARGLYQRAVKAEGG